MNKFNSLVSGIVNEATTPIESELETMANSLFNIGSRIVSKSVSTDDGELLIEYSTVLERIAGQLAKEYDIKPKDLDLDKSRDVIRKQLERSREVVRKQFN
jgi:hypothetical protein